MKPFRRMANALTPRPMRRKATEEAVLTPPPAPAPTQPIITFPELKSLVRKLVTFQNPEDEEAVKIRATLIEKAKEGDPYLIASSMYLYVSGMKKPKGDEQTVYKQNGLDTASELYYIHIRNEIDSIEAGTRPLGPTVFKTYCDELFDCYETGKGFSKAIAYLVMLMEYLGEKAASSPDYQPEYLELAQQAVRTMIEISGRRIDKEAGERSRMLRLRNQGIEPGDDDLPFIDPDILTYLEDLQKRVDYICEEMTKAGLPPSSADAEAYRAHLAHLYRIVQIAQRAGYLGLCARLKEILGLQLHAGRQENAREFLVSAAQDFQAQAEREEKWRLSELSAMRLSKAREILTRVKNDQTQNPGQPPPGPTPQSE